MAKIIFLDETAEQESHEHEARAEDAVELFRLAEKLSEAELEKMAIAINKMPQENPQNPRKN